MSNYMWLILIYLIPTIGFGALGEWPNVQPLTKHYHFLEWQKAKVKTIIRDKGGRPLYMLECYSPATAPQDPDFDYSGDFECRLHSANKKDSYSTLLTELPNASRDWESRGRFLVPEIIDPCGQYKDLGRIRNFRLRGLKLTLAIENLTVSDKQRNVMDEYPAIRSFDFVVTVSQDSGAKSPIAGTPYLPSVKSLPEVCRKPLGDLYFSQFSQEPPKEHKNEAANQVSLVQGR